MATEADGAAPPSAADRREFWRALRARHPRLREALKEDARVTARYRGERHEFRTSLDAAGHHLPLTQEHEDLFENTLGRCLGVPWILEAPLPAR